MSKFAVGEIALSVVLNRNHHDSNKQEQVEILAIPGQPYPNVRGRERDLSDYVVKDWEGTWGVFENNLRKLPGSAIHSSTLALFTRTQRNPDDVPEKSFG